MSLEDSLLTEAHNPRSEAIDSLSSAEIVELMNSEDAKVIEAVHGESQAIAKVIDLTAERLLRGGRLIYVGAGTSGRLGVLDAAECPPTFSTPPSMVIGRIAGGSTALTQAVEGAEDSVEQGTATIDSLQVGPNDVVVGIATSGRTPYVLGAIDRAQTLGAVTVGITCNRPSLLGQRVDVEIAPLVGPEVLAGSTRLKAGTATKLILNMISTGSMVRIGKSFGNRMVDLMPTNEKLRIRTRRILRELGQVDNARAAELLDACQGQLKPAIVMALAGVSSSAAALLLQQGDGQVRRAVELAGPRLGSASASTASFAPLVLGVDGGGTSTVAWLANLDGQVIGTGKAGPSNAKAVGNRAALSALEHAVHSAFHSAGRPAVAIEAACLGLAGFDRPEDKQLLREWAEPSGGGRFRELVLVNDGDLVIAAGTPEGWGVGVIAGTGSIAVARTADGRYARGGGWGHLIGDEGSGYAVALEALRLVARRHDGRSSGPASGRDPLTIRLCGALGIPGPQALVSTLYSGAYDRARIASLAREVVAAANEETELARLLLAPAGRELGLAACSAAKAVGWTGGPLPVALAGSFLLAAEPVRDALLDELSHQGYEPSVGLVDDPVAGALTLARRAVRTP